MKPKEAEDRTGATGDDVEPFVRRDEVGGEQLRHRLRVREQRIVTQALRDHRQRVGDRPQPGGAADAQRAGEARGIPASQGLAQARQAGEGQLARERAPSHLRVRGQKERNAGGAVVEFGTQAYELEDFGVLPSQSASPIQAAPGPRGGWLAGHDSSAGDPVSFRRENLLCAGCAGRVGANVVGRGNAGRDTGLRKRAGIVPDDLDLPGDLLRIEPGGAGARAIEAGDRGGRY